MGVCYVAETFGIDRTTVFRWVRRQQIEGEPGLERRLGSGRPRILQDFDQHELQELVLRPASDFGYETDLWTVGRVRTVLEEVYLVRISDDTVLRRLREAGLTYQKPERQYYEIDEQARQEWARTEIPRIRRAVQEYRAILYFQDEANVSLTAFLGKAWGIRGRTPKVRVAGKRAGVAAMSAISRRGSLLFRL
jgi:transposase